MKKLSQEGNLLRARLPEGTVSWVGRMGQMGRLPQDAEESW